MSSYKLRFYTYLSLSLISLTSCLRDPDPLPSAWDIMSGQPQFSVYLEAATIADFDDDFKSGQGLTYFVPTNDAFEVWLDSMGVNSINDVDKSSLQDIIRYHLISGTATINDLGTNYYLTPASIGPDLTSVAVLIQNVDGKVTLNNDAEVTSRDLEAQNSFIHTINKVLKIPTTLDLLQAT